MGQCFQKRRKAFAPSQRELVKKRFCLLPLVSKNRWGLELMGRGDQLGETETENENLSLTISMMQPHLETKVAISAPNHSWLEEVETQVKSADIRLLTTCSLNIMVERF